jgi:hypothetical protein
VSGSSVISWYINQVGPAIEIYQLIGGVKYSLSFNDTANLSQLAVSTDPLYKYFTLQTFNTSGTPLAPCPSPAPINPPTLPCNPVYIQGVPNGSVGEG